MPSPLSYAVPDAELERALRDLVVVVANVPESERAGWWFSMRRYQSTHPRDEATAIYPRSKLASVWLKLAQHVWAEWPPQEE